ncbi:MAG: hypothetical protein HYR73_09425, partial [Candidatus Eisenbacteria bacterium]|nr:hypothetical protein [Candidatus Eisenbacteria bacterium]
MKKGVRRGRFANAGLRTAAFALGLIVIVGCADPALWPRWVAERDFWHARRLVDRIRVNPRFAKDSDYERAAEAFSSIGRRFPPSAWGHPALPGAARDVAIAAGRSAIAIAKLDEMRGRVESALAGYARAEQEWRAVPSVALEAAIARALVLERAGRASEALEAWGGIAAGYPMVDDERGEVIEPVMDAPLRVAAALERAG